MAVFLAVVNETGDGMLWIKDPMIRLDEVEIHFTPSTAKVVLYGTKAVAVPTTAEIVEQVKIELSRLGLGYTMILSTLDIGACVHGPYIGVPFILSGPLPYWLLSNCDGELVDEPHGLHTRYGG